MDNDDFFRKGKTLKEVIQQLQEEEFEELKKNPVWAEAYERGIEDASREWQLLSKSTIDGLIRIYQG